MYATLEQLLIKAILGESFEEEFQKVKFWFKKVKFPKFSILNAKTIIERFFLWKIVFWKRFYFLFYFDKIKQKVFLRVKVLT